jgi:ring-1,2-phenylacetyl-CoA epoxidase subunit PaaC
MTPGSQEFVLAFADDEHVIGQRHTEWIGLGPFLEEDLALTSIAQDELGHAMGLYSMLTDDVDQLAFFRLDIDYRCCWLVEQPGTDWAYALVRHWLYDLAERHRWEAVSGSSDHRLAGLAGRALREEAYHRRHAIALLERLLDGTDESRARMSDALDAYLPLAVALFEPVTGEAEALAAGVATAPTPELLDPWWEEVAETLTRHELGRDRPEVAPDLQAGRTLRTDHFGTMHDDITEVLRIDPGANW